MNEQINIFSIDRAETLITSISDAAEQESVLYKCVNRILDSKESDINGSTDAFHNFAVSCIKIADDFLTAYEIVCLGLKLHPTNTDLLADAIKYGYNCNDVKRCEEYLSRLRDIDKCVWTWRAFSFTIDYLLDRYTSDSTNSNYISEIKSLSSQYRKRYPDNEDSLFSEYQIYEHIGELSLASDILIEALNASIPCPKCWLKYADILIEKGNFSDAVKPIIKLCNYPLTSDSVNWCYVNYLKGVCQKALLVPEKEDIFDEQQYDERKVNLTYMSFYQALLSSDIYENLKQKIRKHVEEIESASGVPIPNMLENALNS